MYSVPNADRPSRPVGFFWWLGMVGLLALTALTPHWGPVERRQQGEYGADLRLLRAWHIPPGPGESNHFLDLWSGGSFRRFALQHGLGDNHALFVLSHGGLATGLPGKRYAYYPDEQAAEEAARLQFSARDLANALGGEVLEIHNLVVAGCDAEGAFDARELRHCFPNATNIIHTPAGRNGYELALRHFVMYPSADIKLLYATPENFEVGNFEFHCSGQTNRAHPMPYLARLDRAGQDLPYRVQTAGRELLAARPSPVRAYRRTAECLAATHAAQGR